MELRLFDIGDIPVRVSLWYGLLLLYWFQGNGGDARGTLLWVIIVTLSILVHELGHALVARYYRLRPSILLHGLGGLCNHDRAERDRHDVFIIAAGPGAGLLLGLITWVVSLKAPLAWMLNPWFGPVISMSLYVNIGWSLVNLLPIWPLDGGQLYRLLMLRLLKPARAEKVTHYTALGLLALALVYGGVRGTSLLLMLVLWTAWSNVTALRGDTASGPIRTVNKSAKQLLLEAKQAYAKQDFTEAARLGHLLRRELNVNEGVAREGRLILGLSCARIGDHADALIYLRAEPETPEIVEARIECFYALGRDSELNQLLDSESFSKLAPERRKEILDIVRAEA
jgi:stage IV sporulation protein FB